MVVARCAINHSPKAHPMEVNAQNIEAIFKGFNTVFNNAYEAAPKHYAQVSMTVPTQGASETYSWLNAIPGMRKWAGGRVINRLSLHGFTLENEKFESTIAVSRERIEDDRLGVYQPLLSEMGHGAAAHPDELVFDLLSRGFDEDAYDGQPFFDTDHPVFDKSGVERSVSNMQAGSGDAWFLLDTTRAVRPIVWQERTNYTPTALNRESDPNVFMNDEYLYGIRARVNAGFGMWQLAHGSKATLDGDSYAAARAAMMNIRQDHGRIMGINPTLLVVPPSLEKAARKLLKTDHGDGGASNEWMGSAELLVTPYVAAA